MEAVRRMRTRLSMALISQFYAAQSCCHSIRAALRWTLYVSLEFRWRSLLKWLKTEAWIETNFCKLRIRLNFNMAYSRRRKGRWEFSHLLFFHGPTSCMHSLPIVFIAARYDFNLSVTMTFGEPYFFIIFLRKPNAAFRSLRLDTKLLELRLHDQQLVKDNGFRHLFSRKPHLDAISNLND